MDHLPWAGSEELWFAAAKYLLETGHKLNIHYALYRGTSEKLDELAALGADVVPYGYKGVRFNYWVGNAIRKIYRIASNEPLIRKSAWKSADVVLVSQGGCHDGQGWLELLHRNQHPYAVLCQANTEAWWPSDEEAVRLRNYFRAAKQTYFVSKENLRLFRIQIGYEQKNSSVIWNPCQPGMPAKPLPWPCNLGSPLRMAMVGRIEPFAKGQDLMLEVLSQTKWKDRPLHVTIYGRGPWEQTARRIVEQRKLANVTFGGYARPDEIWKTHHMLALPSRHEGMSLAMIEAMWLGRPVLATAVAGAMSEIHHGQNGILAAAATVTLWDRAMEEAWACRHLWQTMGATAAAQIRQKMPANPGEILADNLISLAADK